MGLYHTELGISVNRIRNNSTDSIPKMAKIPPKPSKVLLWTNVEALMLHHWKESNINRLAREAKVGPATAQRIKEQRTSVGLDIIDSVAGVFGLSAWQLLLPSLDPKNVPVTMLSEGEKRLYGKLMKARVAFQEET